MNSYWHKTQKFCVDAPSIEEAVRIIREELNKTVEVGDLAILPYPAEPRLKILSKCPSFCYQPSKCAGRTSCPGSYACSE